MSNTKKNGKKASMYNRDLDAERAMDSLSGDSAFDKYSRKTVEDSFGGTGVKNLDPTKTQTGTASEYSGVLKHRRNMKRLKIALGSALSVIVLVAVGVFAYYTWINDQLLSGVDADLRDALTSADSPTDPFYMLLLGIDGSADRDKDPEYGGNYRSDSMMLVRIDPKNKKAAMISLPRDLQIKNLSYKGKDYGTQKLNAAHAFGGPALAVKTVSEICDVPISHYAEVNFDGFEAAVSAVDGVEIDIAYPIHDKYTGLDLEAGKQWLNGYNALCVCRSRHAYDKVGDGDALRTAYQRQILSALAKKILGSDLATMINSVNSVVPYVTTDMSVGEILGIAKSIAGIDTSDIYTAAMPKDSKTEGGIWFDFVIESKWEPMLKHFKLGEPLTDSDEVDPGTGIVVSSAGGDAGDTKSGSKAKHSTCGVAVRNGNGVDGAGAKALKLIEGIGYKNVDSSNANSQDFEKTLIIYKDATYKSDCETIASTLGVGQVMQNDGTYLMTGDILVVLGSDYS